MSSASSSKYWRSLRWWGVVLVVFLAQIALIERLGKHEPPRPRVGRPGPRITLAEDAPKELLALADPTLFALPHPEGFSGAAWLAGTNQEIQPFAWTEPPRFLELPVQQLAASFPSFSAAYKFELTAPPADLLPELLVAGVDQTQLFPDHSVLRLTGALQNRPLRTPLQLPSWPNAEMLSNSVVQVLIDPEGATFSPILLGIGCGFKEADDYAVRQARNARFAPLRRDPEDTSPTSALAWGELVFEWHTLPATNNPAPKR